MSQPKCGLARIDTGAKQFPFENRFQLAFWRIYEGFNAVACLTNTCPRDPVASELAGERRQFRSTHRVEPERIDRIDVVAEIRHHKPVDLQSRLLRRLLRRSRSGTRRRARNRSLTLRRGLRVAR